jgi:GntR family transcriptional regulator/MocR family aminotransferase
MLGIVLDRTSELHLWRQIYQALKDLMLTGQLKAGESLPSTRELAKELNVSRNTVCGAYDLLIAEGYIISRQGTPARVADGLYIEPDELLLSPGPKSQAAYPISVSFQTGRPDLKLFPRYLWQQLMHKASEALELEAFGYTGPQGLYSLRVEIAAWLFRIRGLKVSPDDIFITAGATHGLHLIAEILCGVGRQQSMDDSRQIQTGDSSQTPMGYGGQILMEDPCHIGMLGIFKNKGCSIIPIPVDDNGLQTECLQKYQGICKSQSISLIYVTPSHQFPLGGILPASRRAALIRFARENDVYIIEDDYDSEFRYSGELIAPLYSMDPHRVIYVGTFSKAVFPALRIGYVILPHPLRERWSDLRTHTDVQNPVLEQAALAEFLRTRKLDRHVRQMRKIYGQRRQVLLGSLKETFGTGWTVYGDSAGLHAAVEFTGIRFDESFKEICLRNGLFITPAESYCIEKGCHQSKLLIGYGHLEPDMIRKGIRMLYDIIQSYSTTTS